MYVMFYVRGVIWLRLVTIYFKLYNPQKKEEIDDNEKMKRQCYVSYLETIGVHFSQIS